MELYVLLSYLLLLYSLKMYREGVYIFIQVFIQYLLNVKQG